MYQWFPTIITRYQGQRWSGRSDRLDLAVPVCVLLIAAVLFGGIVGLPQWVQDEASAVVLVTVAILLVASRDEMARNPMHPLAIAFSLAALNFGVRGFMLRAFNLHIPFHGNPQSHITKACLLIATSLVLYSIGYYSGIGSRLNATLPDIYFPRKGRSGRGILARACLLYSIGWVARLHLFSQNIYHNQQELTLSAVQYKSIFQDIASFSTLSFIAFAIIVFRNRRAVMIVPMLVAEVVYGALYGGATMLVLPFMLLAVVWHIYRKPLSWKYLFGFVFLIIAVVGPATVGWRDAYYAQLANDPTPSLGKVARALVDVASQPEVLTNRQRSLARFGGLDHTLMVLDRVPNYYPYQYGATFLPYVSTMPIPRALWPDKPEVNIGHQFSIQFNDDQNLSKSGTNISIGNVGELYYNFGYIGILLCPCFGIVIRFGWERFKRHLALEQCAGIWLPFVLFEVASVQLAIAFYLGALVRGPIPIFIFSMLLYKQVPRVTRLRIRPVAVQRFAAGNFPAPRHAVGV